MGEPQHHCLFPMLYDGPLEEGYVDYIGERVYVGARWQCTECRQIWVLSDDKTWKRES
jgi:hypothetical protein